MMQLHKIFENPKKAFCFFCFAIIILFADYKSVNGFFYGGGYQWQETRQTANMAEEVSLSELYGADYEIYPFGINDSTAAVFCTECHLYVRILLAFIKFCLILLYIRQKNV